MFGSLFSGHTFVSKSQSDSSRRTHLRSDLEKYNPVLQTLSTGVPSKHKKYRVQENGFGIFETPCAGQIISVGSRVDVSNDEVVEVLDVVKVVVRAVIVVGEKGQLTLLGKSQY